METVSIRMFGPLEIKVGARRLPSFATRKSQSLFSYLLIYRERAHPRDVLAGMFWGEYPDATARKHLRDALWRIRQVLSAANAHGLQLESEGRAVGMEMNHQSWLDISEFERSVNGVDHADHGLTVQDAAQLNNAVQLYRADLLQEVYDDWCVYHRERLRVLALEALQRLMSYHLLRQEWPSALERAQRLLNADPLHEPVHRALMRCYACMGNRSAALKQFQTCCQLLRDELDVAPAADTVALYEEIRRANAPHSEVPAPSEPGRAALVDEALKRLQNANRGLCRTRRDLRAGTVALRRALAD